MAASDDRRGRSADRVSTSTPEESPVASGAGRTAATARLLTAARDARERAVAPFSAFRVGAALEATDGTIITGCNIENASYGLTLCAERVAIFKALSDGHRGFRRIAIVADTSDATAPCGACRQILWEYAGDIEVILANLARETGRHRLKRLLPVPFDAGVLTRSQAPDADLRAGSGRRRAPSKARPSRPERRPTRKRSR